MKPLTGDQDSERQTSGFSPSGRRVWDTWQGELLRHLMGDQGSWHQMDKSCLQVASEGTRPGELSLTSDGRPRLVVSYGRPPPSPASSYASVLRSVPAIQKWTVASLRQVLSNADVYYSRRMNKTELYNIFCSIQSSTPPAKSTPRRKWPAIRPRLTAPHMLGLSKPPLSRGKAFVLPAAVAGYRQAWAAPRTPQP
ncbi:hypothetical protein Q8A67_001540 [Cirrhinus molitorella]|uniref:Uncharacterized protein n=1 Tax=Cirrhinus molitorella TaxID=172907 RepID=A0AA88QBN4_9TELE|nr:hypothetical protein Q8A67_001540 [Cirrhinus molitorella]